jgi:hypothetical protein
VSLRQAAFGEITATFPPTGHMASVRIRPVSEWRVTRPEVRCVTRPARAFETIRAWEAIDERGLEAEAR